MAVGSMACDEVSSDEAPPPCHHAKKSVDPNRVKRALAKGPGVAGGCCECSRQGAVSDPSAPAPSLWLCLQCGQVLCGADGSDHALRHHQTPHSAQHSLAARLRPAPLQPYCYACGRDLPLAPHDRRLLDCLQQVQRAIKDPSAPGPSPSPESSPPPASPPPPPSPRARPVRLQSGSGGDGRVRGLSNLGNTCFFNSVLQCLVQTPYLVSVLREMAEPGERFRLPGGDMTVPARAASAEREEAPERQVSVDSISGELSKWGNLTETLAETLQELQSEGRFDVYNPKKLFNQFVAKVPQFAGGDQHDSHELLRHLLEAVRSEDLRRYHTVILEKFNLNSKENRTEIEDETRLKVKFFGQQASDATLRPGQVFRGMLVSTLECQDCKHSSHTTEHFLDLSLPIMADKPQPPSTQRRKNQEEQLNSSLSSESGKSKHQLKKEKRAAQKQKKSARHNCTIKFDDLNQSEEVLDNKVDKSSSEQSDADIEDNVDDNPKLQGNIFADRRDDNPASYLMESGYNSEKVISSDSIRASPVDLENKEKSDKSPERLDKDFGETKFTTSIPLPYKPLHSSDSLQLSNPDSGVASPETAKNALLDIINNESPMISKELESPTSLSSEINMDISSPRQSNNSPVCAEGMGENSNCADMNEIKKALEKQKNENFIKNLNEKCEDKVNNVSSELARLEINEGRFGSERKYDSNSYDMPNYTDSCDTAEKSNDFITVPKNYSEESELYIRTSPDSDTSKWKKDAGKFSNRNFAVASRSQYSEEGEYSIQSCLNQFTSSELLTGNNKVGCEVCTKRANTGKTVYTNATKRFRVSNLPAVMILHLKRFQLGPRCILRKIPKHVNFPTVLDIGPFCSDDVKKMPSVSPNQTKILYSLYGIVEHSGNMHLGHYVAYVKVRPDIKPDDPRLAFLSGSKKKDLENKLNGACNDDTDSSASGYESGEGAVGGSEVDPPTGKWYYVSDSQVSETTEEKVLGATAYLLFYERIL